MEDFAGPGLRGFFRAERVWIENVHGECLADRSMPRAAFGSFRRQIWWDNLDLLYFAGYAAWNYLTFPFVLASAEEVQELEVWSEQGEIWQRLRVRFPKQLPTHSREQVFYFDEHFRLRRFDYDPFVYASWARAAHYCSHYKEFGGLLAPTRRRVLPRRPVGRSRPWPTLVWIKISNVSLKGVERPTNESQHLERR